MTSAARTNVLRLLHTQIKILSNNNFVRLLHTQIKILSYNNFVPKHMRELVHIKLILTNIE